MKNTDFTIKNGILTGYDGSGGDIAIPDGVTAIGDSAFHSCAKLAGISIPEGVTRIGSYAFAHCKGLASVSIPASLAWIRDSAFLGCDRLAEVRYAGTQEQWGKIEMGSVTIRRLGAVLRFAADSADAGKEAASMEAAGFVMQNDILIEYTGPGGNVAIPDGVALIADGAFAGRDDLSSVSVPDSVKAIGDGAFAGCTGLKGIAIPEGAVWIGGYAFAGCTALKDIAIPGDVALIGQFAFWNCTDLARASIPASVIKIGRDAFLGCDRLAEVRYAGTREQWREIDLAGRNRELHEESINFANGHN